MRKITNKVKQKMLEVMSEYILLGLRGARGIRFLVREFKKEIGAEWLNSIGYFLLTNEKYCKIFGHWNLSTTLQSFDMSLTLAEAKVIMKAQPSYYPNGWVTDTGDYTTKLFLSRVFVTPKEIIENPELLKYLAILSKKNPKLENAKDIMLLFNIDGKDMENERVKLSSDESRKSLKNLKTSTIINNLSKFKWHQILSNPKAQIPMDVLENKKFASYLLVGNQHYWSKPLDGRKEYFKRGNFQLPLITIENMLSADTTPISSVRLLLIALSQKNFHTMLEKSENKIEKIRKILSDIEIKESEDYFSGVKACRIILAGLADKIFSENILNEIENILFSWSLLDMDSVFYVSRWVTGKFHECSTTDLEKTKLIEKERENVYRNIKAIRDEIDPELSEFLGFNNLPEEYEPRYDTSFETIFRSKPFRKLSDEEISERRTLLGLSGKDVNCSGLEYFNDISVDHFDQLEKEDLIDTSIEPGGKPKMSKILDFVRKYPDDITCFGYLISHKREDTAVVIKGISFNSERKDIYKDLMKTFNNLLDTNTYLGQGRIKATFRSEEE